MSFCEKFGLGSSFAESIRCTDAYTGKAVGGYIEGCGFLLPTKVVKASISLKMPLTCTLSIEIGYSGMPADVRQRRNIVHIRKSEHKMIKKECFTAEWIEQVSSELHYNDKNLIESNPCPVPA